MRNGRTVHDKADSSLLGFGIDGADKQKKDKDIPLEVVGPFSETNKSTF